MTIDEYEWEMRALIEDFKAYWQEQGRELYPGDQEPGEWDEQLKEFQEAWRKQS
jgi:hypothetical protein